MFLYVCPKCGSVGASSQVEEMVCKASGCGAKMALVKGTKEIPIQDLQGKTLGTLLLTDEVINVLKTTGVSLVVEFDANSTKESVIGYLH